MRSELTETPPPPTKGERYGSAFAHGAVLVVGLPLIPILQLPLALVPCPVISYFIGKHMFRRHNLTWGAFQCMQASVAQLILVLLSIIFWQVNPAANPEEPSTSQVALGVGVAGMLLFIYTIWGAWDCLFGINFRYLLLGNFIERVSQVNMSRQERRRAWLGRRNDPPPPPDQNQPR